MYEEFLRWLCLVGENHPFVSISSWCEEIRHPTSNRENQRLRQTAFTSGFEGPLSLLDLSAGLMSCFLVSPCATVSHGGLCPPAHTGSAPPAPSCHFGSPFWSCATQLKQILGCRWVGFMPFPETMSRLNSLDWAAKNNCRYEIILQLPL